MEGATIKYKATESIGVIERKEQEAKWWEQEHTKQPYMLKIVRKQTKTRILYTDKGQVETETAIILADRQ